MSNSTQPLRAPFPAQPAQRLPARTLQLPCAPSWVAALEPVTSARELAHDEFAWIEAELPNAAALPERAFEEAVRALYAETLARLRARGATPLRIWNYLPGMHTPGALYATRYEAFCAGRQRGYAQDGAGSAARGRAVAGSAVERPGDDFTLHVLACNEGGRALENPRQVPAWRYSARYGVLPPCFARAVVLEGRAVERVAALVSGTASIVGEDSRHAGDLAAQLEETLRNLEAVALLALPERTRESAQPLAAYDALRVYAPEAAQLGPIAAVLAERAPEAQLELAPARLCRAELLVEIEAMSFGRGARASRQ